MWRRQRAELAGLLRGGYKAAPSASGRFCRRDGSSRQPGASAASRAGGREGGGVGGGGGGRKALCEVMAGMPESDRKIKKTEPDYDPVQPLLSGYR